MKMKLVCGALGLLMAGCASVGSQPDKAPEARSLASDQSMQAKLQKLYMAYVHGFELMQDFDQNLGSVDKPLETETYARLLAVRAIVDQIENSVVDFYLNETTPFATSVVGFNNPLRGKTNIERINTFLEGAVSDRALAPDLRILTLTNIRYKFVDLGSQLSDLGNEARVKGDIVSATAYENHAAKLRSLSARYQKEMEAQTLNPDAILLEAKYLAQNPDYQSLVKEVAEIAPFFKQAMDDSRDPASDVITPSTGGAGNITGSGFPRGTWAMTYDDGPGTKTSEQVLENLRQSGTKATFFMLAGQAVAHTAMAQRIKAAGMDIACHSWDHPQMPKLGPVQMNRQIAQATAKIEALLGVDVKLFRLPYGAGVSNSTIRQKIAAANLVHVFWNVDTLDWQDKNPATIHARAMKQINKLGRGIILFHDIHPQSVIASNQVVKSLQSAGATLCTVQGVVDQINKQLPTCK